MRDGSQPDHAFPAPGGSSGSREDTKLAAFEFKRLPADPAVNCPRFRGGIRGVLTSVDPGSWIHAAVVGRLRASNSTGVSIPSEEWRRWRLWKISRSSKIAFASSTRVRHRFRSSNSTCTRLRNDSMTALSKQSPTEPIEGRRPEWRARLVNAHEVNCVWSL